MEVVQERLQGDQNQADAEMLERKQRQHKVETLRAATCEQKPPAVSPGVRLSNSNDAQTE